MSRIIMLCLWSAPFLWAVLESNVVSSFGGR